MLAKMMLPAGAQTCGQAEMRVTQTGAQTGGTAELRVVVQETGLQAIPEVAFAGIHVAKEAENALGGIVLRSRPSRWTVLVATSTFSTSCRSTSIQRVLQRMPQFGSLNLICSSYKHS